MERPKDNAADSRVLKKLNILLKSAIQECLPEFPVADCKWTTLRHTAFRLTLEDDSTLGIPPKINAFADNGHTSADQLRSTYLKYIDLEGTAKKSRKTIAPRKQVRWGGRFKSKKDIN